MPRWSESVTLLPGCPWRPWLELPWPGPRFGDETRDWPRGRVRVTLFKGHPYATSGGWQWRYRLVVAYELGYLPRPDEHVDHRNEVVDDDRLENLRLLAVEFHGQLHAAAWELAGRRGPDGRWRELEEPGRCNIRRLGPVLSTSSIDPRTWRPTTRQLEARP